MGGSRRDVRLALALGSRRQKQERRLLPGGGHTARMHSEAEPDDAEETPIGKLESLGVRGILRQLAQDGQLVDVQCEMPQCYCSRGRKYFAPNLPHSEWSP